MRKKTIKKLAARYAEWALNECGQYDMIFPKIRIVKEIEGCKADYYDNVIRVSHAHIESKADLKRTIAHEIIHHMQWELGQPNMAHNTAFFRNYMRMFCVKLNVQWKDF